MSRVSLWFLLKCDELLAPLGELRTVPAVKRNKSLVNSQICESFLAYMSVMVRLYQS